MFRHSIGLAAVVAVVVSACGSQPPASPNISAASARASSAATASPVPSVQPLSGDAALEDLLPDEIAGQPLSKTSLTGPDFVSSGTAATFELGEFAAALNARSKEVSIAYAYETSQVFVWVFAFRAGGVAQETLVNELEVAVGGSGTVWENLTVGGKSVLHPTDPARAPLYVYPTGDTIFLVRTAEPSVADEVFAKLP